MNITKKSLFFVLAFYNIQTEILASFSLHESKNWTAIEFQEIAKRRRLYSDEKTNRDLIALHESLIAKHIIKQQQNLQETYTMALCALQKGDENSASLHLNQCFNKNQIENLVRMALWNKELIFILLYILQDIEHSELSIYYTIEHDCFIIGFKKTNKNRTTQNEPFIILKTDFLDKVLTQMYYYDFCLLNKNKNLIKFWSQILNIVEGKFFEHYFEANIPTQLSEKSFTTLSGKALIELFLQICLPSTKKLIQKIQFLEKHTESCNSKEDPSKAFIRGCKIRYLLS